MFDTVPLNPPDSIFGLIEQFKADSRSNKVNLSVGVYQDESGKTPLMRCVRAAEALMLEESASKSYLPIDGHPEYNQRINRLILGESFTGHSATAQTPGGTAALRVAGEVMQNVLGVKQVWISDPTWGNHLQIYNASDMDVQRYGYLDEAGTGLGFEKAIDGIGNANSGDAVLLHTVCHNPTGVDLGREQWEQLFELILSKKLIPVFDFAYQGFGDGIEEDAWPIRRFCELGGEGFVCNSFSKNFGLYGERVGGVSAIAKSEDAAEKIRSQIKLAIRTMYSNPPMHGAVIVNTVLGDKTLRADWVKELGEMRDRMKDMRSKFVACVNDITPERDFEYVNRQRGMFSYSGLTREQVYELRENHAIYALTTGRINVAGLNSANMERISKAIANVMA